MGLRRKNRINLAIIFVASIAGSAFAGRFKVLDESETVIVESRSNKISAPDDPDDAPEMQEDITGRGGWVFPSETDAAPPPAGAPRRRVISTPQECARTCVQGESPKLCYYQFTVEFYATLTNACKTCRSNTTMRFTPGCQCITADGYELSGIIVANRMYPGPAIVVCHNDIVVVDVDNRVPGNAVTIHWHGITQAGTQYYDGVPYVTQCPINEGNKFRYKWRAANTGSHFWHAHTGLHKAVGLEGPLVVREPKTGEINSHLWDEEDVNHVIFISDWFHDSIEEHLPGTVVRRPGQLPDNFLINGLGRWTDPVYGNTTTTPRAVFTVKPNTNYRFRMINSCTMVCPVTLTIEGHTLLVIQTDGEPVDPVEVTSITSASAERYDFVLKAKKKGTGDYWIQVRAIGACARDEKQQLAVLRYDTPHPVRTATWEPTYALGLTRGVVLNELNVRCDNRTVVKDVVCVTDLKSVEKVPERTLRRTPDVRIYMPFGFHSYLERDIFREGTYKKFLVTAGRQFASLVSNISNTFPPSTLISQLEDNPKDQLCNPDNLPKRCRDSAPCFCTHVYEIPLKSSVELILVDEAQIPGLSHPFHLHGAAFHVLGEGCGDDYNISSINIDIVRDMDNRGLLKRRYDRPPAKDTFSLPNNGFSIIRFYAINPGYWLFHCHFLPHLNDGMSAIFHVGTPRDLPPVPKNFPKCGHFLPDI